MPREEVTLREATAEELEAFRQAKRDFQRDKARVTMTRPYGLQHSPHYARRSRVAGAGARDSADAGTGPDGENTTPDAKP